MKRILLETYWGLTRAYLRLKGAKVGRSVRCNGLPHIRIRRGGQLVIGDEVMINCTPRSNPLNVSGAMNLYVASGATLRLGARCGISSCQIIANTGIELGEETLVGAGSLLCDSDMHEIPLGSDKQVRMAPIHIGNRVFIGARSILLKGVRIGDSAVIGAGSVVTGEIPAGTVAAGNPAREFRRMN